MLATIIVVGLIQAVLSGPHQVRNPEWENFKRAHSKVYGPEEEERRFQIFSENLEKIEKHNDLHAAGLESYRMGINQFADITSEEFINYLSLFSSNTSLYSEPLGVFDAPAYSELPKSVDYRKKKAVNPVKNQGPCESCWAFSAVGALESINFLKTGKLLNLSEQNLVDCSRSYGGNGCNGGFMWSGYNYVRDNGIETERDYPYEAKENSCRFNQSESVLTIKGYTNIKIGSENALQAAVATVGPIAVGVDASEWQLYQGGIFSKSGYNVINHGVVVVGYGSENGKDYWIIRNSWGPRWGESGYIRVARNDNNQLGITDMACYPNL